MNFQSKKKHKSITVLISSVGRSISLVKQFKSSLPFNGRVITADNDPLASAAPAADLAYIAPRIDSKRYNSWMLSLCKREKVSLLISLLPEELLKLETLRPSLTNLGVKLIGMPKEWIKICLDKQSYNVLCEGTNFQLPQQWKLNDIEQIPKKAYPLVAKKIKGKGSIGLSYINNKAKALELANNLKCIGSIDDYFFQCHLEGQEYGLDLINDLDGKNAGVFIRRKLRMRDGETEIAETVTNQKLEIAGYNLATKLAHQGLVDCDVICSNGEFYLLDVNTRFGGGHIFSQNAGANIPAAIIDWSQGKKPNLTSIKQKSGITSARISQIQRLSVLSETFTIITSGSHKIGMGHAFRQISFALTAMKAGYSPIILTDSEIVAKCADKSNVKNLLIKIKNKDSLSELLKHLRPSFVVIDVHEKDFPNYSWVANYWRTQLIVSRVCHDFDLYGENVFFIGEDLNYWKVKKEKWIPNNLSKVKIYTGRAFIYFRKEFDIDLTHLHKKIDNQILITHGGSNPNALTQKCLEALQLTNNAYDIKVLVGPSFKDIDHIKILSKKSKHKCELLIGKTEVAEVMSTSGIALINGGNTRYELCVTGTPFIALSLQEKQYKFTEQLTKEGAGINIGLYHKVSLEQLSKEIDQLYLALCFFFF